MTSLALEGAHWTFALQLYGQPGVADACLLLQDRLDVDVNVLLTSLFAVAQRGIAVDECDLRRMDAVVKAWREEIVIGLRQIRRRMKSGPPPGPDEITERLRAQVKTAELHAEQIQQAALVRWLEAHATERDRSHVDAGVVLQRVIDYFALVNGAPKEVVRSAVLSDEVQILRTAVAQISLR